MDFKKYANTLELNKVLVLLAEKAVMQDTKNRCIETQPSFNQSAVKNQLKITSDAYMLIARFGTPSFGAAKNMNSALTSAKAGGILTMKTLLEIGELFRVIRSLKAWHSANAGVSTSLDDYFNILSPNQYFEDKIFICIKNEDEMSDNASPALSDIRRKQKNAALNLKNRLESLIHDPKHAVHLQDAIITQRRGRYVVPVKAEYRSQVNGLVHDTSASGATLFIEPVSVVEINNEIKMLESLEKEEIERILSELSAEASQFADSAMQSYSALVELDLAFAKANLAFAMKATVPDINNKKQIRLKNARHPLINSKTVVPITVELGFDYSLLVITGPNTGGKTVALKTIGLLTLMVCCGLMIPVDDNSTVYVFSGVFADIGDEQSIEQSLSTFSSHMNNIIKILNYADSCSLVLFDELCSGTDPVEGAALSTAILSELKRRGASVAATTHYAELKAYALETDGVENACCEFDIKSLKPTYRLLVGIPGRSNAFAISKRLGLSSELVESAQKLVSEENSHFEVLVGKLEQAHTEVERNRAQIQFIKSQLEQTKKSAGERLHEIEVQRGKILEQARAEANYIIEQTREKSSALLNELEDLKKQINRQNNISTSQKARNLAKSSIKIIENAVDSATDRVSAKPKKAVLKRPLEVGDTVMVEGFGRPAVIEKLSDDLKFAFVAIGAVKTKVSVKDLSLCEEKLKQKEPHRRNVRGITPKSERVARRELDIRGFASDEGIMEVDKFLDDAVLAGVEFVTVIHGKGTGVLKKAVRSHLKNHPCVKSSRPGLFGEGEDGVTVVELK